MSEKYNIFTYSTTDKALLSLLGNFVRHHRLEQNKSQSQLAQEAGINRSTLIEFEKGSGTTLLTFIQLLRALRLLQLLETFEVRQQVSPLLLAEMELKKRKRASRGTEKPGPKKTKPDW